MSNKENRHRKVERRTTAFAEKTTTRIWYEKAAENNPFLAEACFCHGYNLLDLAKERSFVEVLFLLFQGELPNKFQRQFLEILMIAMINPGPRHPATRAAMLAGVGKTDVAHILPIGLSILGGTYLGAGEVKESMLFLEDKCSHDPSAVLREHIDAHPKDSEGDWHPAPGFGSRFGGIDVFSNQIASLLVEHPGAGRVMSWGQAFSSGLNEHGGGWLAPGLLAAAMLDLGFDSMAGSTLYQFISAPGILAHGLELAGEPITAMPFPSDENYIIE